MMTRTSSIRIRETETNMQTRMRTPLERLQVLIKLKATHRAERVDRLRGTIYQGKLGSGNGVVTIFDLGTLGVP